MGNWIERNHILYFLDSQKTEQPLVAEVIYSCRRNGYFSYENQRYETPEKELGIHLSKFGISCILRFDYLQGKIQISLFGKKNNELVQIPFVNSFFHDSIIIDNTWYYIAGDYAVYKDIVGKLDTINISYTRYAEILRQIKNLKLDVIDNVILQLNNSDEKEQTFLPRLIQADLYDYQKIGCNWLSFMYINGCGAILADEMGLGKTLQIISLFAYIYERGEKPLFLVIVPLSLLENWKREINSFYPNFKVLINHGKTQTYNYHDFLAYDIVVTTYENVKRNFSLYHNQSFIWDLIVLDEAQAIKNPESQASTLIRQINRKCGIAVTGTPFENHITDVWSLTDFIYPGFLGSLTEFKKDFEDDNESADSLETIITPLMIRRRLKDVAKNLPPRIDISCPIVMSESEASLYESERTRLTNEVDLKTFTLMDMQKLRMFCVHPAVYDNKIIFSDPTECSSKYVRLCEILSEIIENKEKVLIFTTFTTMINIMVSDLKKRFGCYTNFINGEVNGQIDGISKRQAVIDEFSEIQGSAILVLNPIAGGKGLNITAANHVIHYNLEWNPATEAQASARAHRTKQEKTVFVYNLFYTNTIEEVINQRIERKKELADIAIVGNTGTINKQDLLTALNLSPYGGK